MIDDRISRLKAERQKIRPKKKFKLKSRSPICDASKHYEEPLKEILDRMGLKKKELKAMSKLTQLAPDDKFDDMKHRINLTQGIYTPAAQ